jgi:hypothetical protein
MLNAIMFVIAILMILAGFGSMFIPVAEQPGIAGAILLVGGVMAVILLAIIEKLTILCAAEEARQKKNSNGPAE